jgi:hypothetical protein
MKKAAILIPAALAWLISLRADYRAFPIGSGLPEAAPVLFRENRDVRLNLYPRDFQSASVFTTEGLSPATRPAAIAVLAIRLANSRAGGTFFVTPSHPGKFEFEELHLKILTRLDGYGYEIAQHGFPAPGREGKKKAIESDRSSRGGEWKKELKADREILTSLGLPPQGYRAGSLAGEGVSLSVLDELGYLYRSESIPASSNLTGPREPARPEGELYPCHPPGLGLLKVTSRVDPTERPEEARAIFQQVHRQGGVFVFHTRLPGVSELENLDRLQEFLNYLRTRNTWSCSLRELCRWWRAREKVDIKTRRDGDTMIVVYDNPEPFPLKNAGVIFKEGDPSLQMYRVTDAAGRISAEGFIPPSRRVNVTLFAHEKAPPK